MQAGASQCKPHWLLTPGRRSCTPGLSSGAGRGILPCLSWRARGGITRATGAPPSCCWSGLRARCCRCSRGGRGESSPPGPLRSQGWRRCGAPPTILLPRPLRPEAPLWGTSSISFSGSGHQFKPKLPLWSLVNHARAQLEQPKWLWQSALWDDRTVRH